MPPVTIFPPSEVRLSKEERKSSAGVVLTFGENKEKQRAGNKGKGTERSGLQGAQVAGPAHRRSALPQSLSQQFLLMNIAVVDIDNTLWQFCDAFTRN